MKESEGLPLGRMSVNTDVTADIKRALDAAKTAARQGRTYGWGEAPELLERALKEIEALRRQKEAKK